MFQISLRQLLLLMAAVALAIVSLKYNSIYWQAAVGLITIVVLFAAAIVGVFDRGPRQVFCIAVVLVMLGYALLILNGRKTTATSGTVTNQELRGSGGLPMTVLLHDLFELAQGPPANPNSAEEASFVRTGHCWWALIFGYFGGCFARSVYQRRTREQATHAQG